MNAPAHTSQLLLFGGTGAIGSAIAERFLKSGWRVVIVTRQANDIADSVQWDPLDPDDQVGSSSISAYGSYEAVCWAQGQNCNDSIYDVNISEHEQLYRANCLYTLASMQFLVRNNLLAKPARLCVISSIWQNISRQNKLSYAMTKAACQGLVLSAANDLGRDGHLINAVLPGALDTPMTRNNLTPEQLANLEGGTQFGRLATLNDVASAVEFLCSGANMSLTGQFIKVDLGYSDVRIV